MATSNPPLSEAALARIAQQRLEPVWYACDRAWRVTARFGSPAAYGFDESAIGADLRESLAFVHGLDQDEAIELEFIETPNGRCVHAGLAPRADGAELLLLDATDERDQRQALQQKSNEVALLLGERERLLESLERKNEETSRLNRLQARFIANMSHEFRTPLSSIVGYTQFLRAGDRRIPLASGLESIDRAARHLLNLIDNLIDQAQFEVGEVELRPVTASVTALFEDMAALFQPLAAAKGLEFRCRVPAGGPDKIEIDETRWRQILVNILGNAFKYTDTGAVELAGTWADGRFDVTIRDTGVGIATASLEKVFEPFHRETTTSVGGAGLGLSITRRLIELMDGEIRIDSEPALGTTVSLRLPAPATPVDNASGLATRTRQPVLVVEDDSDVYDIVEIYLDDAGYAVVNAVTGAAALAACAAAKPAAIVMDLNLPDMSGFELARSLRATGFAGSIVMLTASSLSSDRASALDAGCDEFLVKPVSPDRLVGVLARLIDAGSTVARP